MPITIQESNYFANILKRVATGDASQRAVTKLERFLNSNRECVWENSWVRFPAARLSPLTKRVLDRDLLADKKRPQAGMRGDANKFVSADQGSDLIRVPISYLLKLSLAEVIASQAELPLAIRHTTFRLMDHFLSDNTSPETVSFYVVPLRVDNSSGKALASETAKRYLLTQLLVMYTNRKFGLEESGQKALLYFSPHPPVRQKELNECIADAFYRELFMSPCLSGWDNGEEKQAYMHLCHQVLSRSQLNAVAKLREAGIITRNLVTLPNMSNISLANNGTHISLGSRKLSRCLEGNTPDFTAAHEKYLGDLVIKIVEHFLPLFVATYSAAPYRLAFSDFHPERVLGFLPHELDYTHLRMIWRRWKKKASLGIFGNPVTPFGLEWLDDALAGLFRMRGDFVRDFRLIDYPVAMMGTNRNPGLDGSAGSEERLKKDLADLGIFDSRMLSICSTGYERSQRPVFRLRGKTLQRLRQHRRGYHPCVQPPDARNRSGVQVRASRQVDARACPGRSPYGKRTEANLFRCGHWRANLLHPRGYRKPLFAGPSQAHPACAVQPPVSRILEGVQPAILHRPAGSAFRGWSGFDRGNVHEAHHRGLEGTT